MRQGVMRKDEDCMFRHGDTEANKSRSEIMHLSKRLPSCHRWENERVTPHSIGHRIVTFGNRYLLSDRRLSEVEVWNWPCKNGFDINR
jgi:hypothetical protein